MEIKTSYRIMRYFDLSKNKSEKGNTVGSMEKKINLHREKLIKSLKKQDSLSILEDIGYVAIYSTGYGFFGGDVGKMSQSILTARNTLRVFEGHEGARGLLDGVVLNCLKSLSTKKSPKNDLKLIIDRYKLKLNK